MLTCSAACVRSHDVFSSAVIAGQAFVFRREMNAMYDFRPLYSPASANATSNGAHVLQPTVLEPTARCGSEEPSKVSATARAVRCSVLTSHVMLTRASVA
eukprot:2908309-Rhodomonas_salina.1